MTTKRRAVDGLLYLASSDETVEFGRTGTTGIGCIEELWLRSYDVYGSPVTAGIPTSPVVFLNCTPNPPADVLCNLAVPGYPLRITGANTQQDLQHAVQILNGYNSQGQQYFKVRVLDKDGAPAVFTDAYLYVTFILKDVSYDPAFVSSLPHIASARFNAVSLGN